MAISEAYRRGYRRAVQDAANVAWSRKLICEDAREGYSKSHPGEPTWAASEGCAAREASYIWEEILKLDTTAK